MIQAINSVTAVNSQPIRPVNFAGRRPSAEEVYMKEQTLGNNEDTVSFTNNTTLEQKYDLACRIAAYYKAQYDELVQNGSCSA